MLGAVASGASYDVTNHGEVVALLGPPSSTGELRVRRATDELVAYDARLLDAARPVGLRVATPC